MSTPSMWLKDGAAALKQGDYTAAISSLKAFCDSPVSPESQAYFQGHKWLVQAYVKAEQAELALAICLKMAESSTPAIQAWANQAIPGVRETLAFAVEIEPSPSLHDLDPAEIKERINQAVQSFRRGDNGQVIALLEPLSDRLDPHSADYGRAQMTLAKAYQAEGEIEKAIALSQVMMRSDRDDISIWGKQFLNRIKDSAKSSESPKPSPSVAIEDSASLNSAPGSRTDSRTDSRIDAEPDSGIDSDTNSAANSDTNSSANSDTNSAAKSDTKSNSTLNPDTDLGGSWAADRQKENQIQKHSRTPKATAQPSVSGITYQPPADSRPIPAQYQPNPAAANRVANDHTAVIQSAVSHGVVTPFFGAFLSALFPDAIAVLFNLMVLSIPVVIYCVATDPIAKENAKEATNYVITSVVVGIFVLIGAFLTGMSLMSGGLGGAALVILLAFPLVIYGLMLAIWPAVATLVCIANPDRTFHYPRWLVWHALK